MRTTLQDLINSGGTIIADGGMGTTLFDMGLEQGASPELWNVNYPERIRGVHRDYIKAGAQIILTNTFGCNALRLKLHDLQERVTELNKAAAELAISEAEVADQPVVVAGDIGPTGSLLKPLGDVTYEEMVDVFEAQARALIETGVDVIWIETMSAIEEVRAAAEATKRVDPDFPIVTTMTFDTNGHTMMGIAPTAALDLMKDIGVIALGGNCGNGPDEIIEVIAKMRDADPEQVIVAKANAGIPHLENGVPVYDGTPDIMGEYAIKVRNLGANIVGACCGSTPNHIRRMKESLEANPLQTMTLDDLKLADTGQSTNGQPARKRQRVRDRLQKDA